MKEDPFSGGYSLSLHTTLANLGISVALNEADYLPKIKRYIEQLVVNLGNRFPHCRVLTLLGYLDPRNVSQATPAAIMELAECFHVDQAKFWSEYLVYRSLAGSLQPEEGQSVMEKVIQVVLGPDNREAMNASFPLISDVLCRLSVLPATSAQAERNRLKISTLSALIHVSTVGPPLHEWDPTPAMKLWESTGRRRIETFKH